MPGGGMGCFGGKPAYQDDDKPRGVRTALILRGGPELKGPEWREVAFDDIKRGDLFIVVENGKEIGLPCLAETNAEAPPDLPELGFVRSTCLHGFTKTTAAGIYDLSRFSGFGHDAIARGFRAMRNQPISNDSERSSSEVMDWDVPIVQRIACWWPYIAILVVCLLLTAAVLGFAGGVIHERGQRPGSSSRRSSSILSVPEPHDSSPRMDNGR